MVWVVFDFMKDNTDKSVEGCVLTRLGFGFLSWSIVSPRYGHSIFLSNLAPYEFCQPLDTFRLPSSFRTHYPKWLYHPPSQRHSAKVIFIVFLFPKFLARFRLDVYLLLKVVVDILSSDFSMLASSVWNHFV